MAATVATANETRSAPKRHLSVGGWLRENLFSNWYNSLLTVIALYIIYFTVSSLWEWGITNAVWEAQNRRECFNINPDGACWAGVIAWFENIIWGRYPREEMWRINLGFLLLIVWLAPIWIPRIKGKIFIAFSAVFFYPFLAGYLFIGGDKGLFMQVVFAAAVLCLIANTLHVLIGVLSGRSLRQMVIASLGLRSASEKTQRNVFLLLIAAAFALIFWWQSDWVIVGVKWIKWGGLFLTLVISGVGISFALPGGIVLALGRRSQLPVIRMICTGFIEIFRSVPLITILFMATTMFPLFLPEGFVLNKLVQVIVAVCLFNACYMAEVVRAGLQAIPKGQYEAAMAMGLGYWKMMGLIVMPQALKYMIPNIVGNFIGLLKDTTLVSIIGLFDILNMIRAVSQDVPWRGLHREPLFVGAVIFFVLCAAMSKYSRHLEATLGGGKER
ncbi:MAG: amino acid ABC transporter permease [Alphaproteobacteria bacterium]